MSTLVARERNISWAKIALVTLAVITLAINFVQGIALGERDVLYYPMFRTQVTIAIALSMMHKPPASGYRAYDDISNALVAHGFYIGDRTDDAARRAALFEDTGALNNAIDDALQTPVDITRETITLPGNDLGAVDFIYLAFRMFGAKVSSLYYLYFVILLASTFMFIVQFWRSRFMLLVLCDYLALHLLMIEWAHDVGPAVGSISNTRTFTVLALLPALHLAALLVSVPTEARPFAPAVIQACVLGFLIGCRFDAAWEAGFVVICALSFGVFSLAGSAEGNVTARLSRLGCLWPVAVMLLVLAIMTARLNFTAAAAYRFTAERHLIWENVLTGFLADRDLRYQYSRADINDPHLLERSDLRRIQDPDVGPIFVPTDLEVAGCEAVKSYLRQKHDSRGFPGSVLDCDLEQNGPNGHSRLSFPDYDELALRVSVIILRDHPIKALNTLYCDLRDEIAFLHNYYRFTPKLISLPLLIMLACLSIYWGSIKSIMIKWRGLGRACFVGAVVLACAIVELMMAGSPHVLGAVASYLLAFLLCASVMFMVSATFLARQSGRVLRRAMTRTIPPLP
jgi:hypothetical protein